MTPDPAKTGPLIRVALVACSGRKASAPTRARDLYRSPIFRLASVVAQSPRYTAWAILSAKHGVLLPDTVVAPYNVALERMKARERREWAAACRERLKELWPDATFVVFGGEDYVAVVAGLKAELPLKGLRGCNARVQTLRAMAGRFGK